MTNDDPFMYQRRMPHWRRTSSTYFVTWRLYHQQPELSGNERSIIEDSVRFFDGNRFTLDAWVVMNDHVHVLFAPEAGHTVERIVQSWKSYSAHQLTKSHSRQAPVWQQEYFDRVIRDEDEFNTKIRYIANNPAKRWPDIETYPWLGVATPWRIEDVA